MNPQSNLALVADGNGGACLPLPDGWPSRRARLADRQDRHTHVSFRLRPGPSIRVDVTMRDFSREVIRYAHGPLAKPANEGNRPRADSQPSLANVPTTFLY